MEERKWEKEKWGDGEKGKIEENRKWESVVERRIKREMERERESFYRAGDYATCD